MIGRRTAKKRLSAEIDSMLKALEEDLEVTENLEEDIPEDELVSDDQELEEDVEADDLDMLDEVPEVEEASDDEDEDDLDDLEANDDEDEDDLEADDDDSMQDDLEDLDLEDDGVEASETAPGIEDTITDTGKGGDPTVQNVTPAGSKAKKEVETDAEVFPTNSEYVAKITAKLDKIASVLETNGNKKLAYRIDKVSDYLENNK